MECSCSAYGGYDGDDGGGYGGKRELTARKPHNCYECGKKITKGDKFLYHTIFFPGTIGNYKYCQTCQSLVDNFFPNGWMFGRVIEDLSEYIYHAWQEDLPSDCISKLTPAARDIVCDILQGFQEK